MSLLSFTEKAITYFFVPIQLFGNLGYQRLKRSKRLKHYTDVHLFFRFNALLALECPTIDATMLTLVSLKLLILAT